MNREKVASPVLKSVGYDKKRELLETELVNDTVYEYYKMPSSEYINLIMAFSLREYYNRKIKNYPYKKLKQAGKNL